MGQNGTGERARRRWHFGTAIFDESAWTLTVAGRPVAIEIKPLELLRALLLRPGETVSKDELLAAVWPDVVVVEASLATAVSKLRKALGDDDADQPIIATVPRIGYRLTAPVRLELVGDLASEMAPENVGAIGRRNPEMMLVGIAAAATLAAAAFWQGPDTAGNAAAPQFTLHDAKAAVRQMDARRIETLIAAGWSPATPFDDQQNGALNILLERCEWDPGHDRKQLMMAARLLVDGGTSLTKRNIWGDTAYSIAKAPRYCGPDHPVTVMLRRLCTSGDGMVLADCEADYAGAKRKRAAIAATKSGS